MNENPQIFQLLPNFSIPWLRLVNSPTPIFQLKTIGNVTNCNNLWLKNDGETGNLFGGNKIRNLEFLIPDALRKKASTLITFGSIESNHAIATALYGKAFNLKVKLYLCNLSNSQNKDLEKHLSLLSKIGAEVFIVSKRRCFLESHLSKHHITSLYSPCSNYIIPIGGASPTGCLGHINAAIELYTQIQNCGAQKPFTIFLPVGSGGTIAGLIAGFTLLQYPVHIVGVYVSKGPSRRSILNLAKQTLKLVLKNSKKETIYNLSNVSFELTGKYKGQGYRIPTDKSTDIEKLFRERESIYLDDTYASKAACALLDYSKLNPNIGSNIFWHTSNNKSL
ncbi:pyridoxal-phosphate dependent enzyme [Pseudoflavitalea sp. X16]|uniref:1-aminocyclopropane-1-carboxylate deaminase/D-cysteine desulfhydrase n=1 Tax=Paraflavitalea devenefica TaxID=2716334 RepID=UPI00141F2CE4|nr:pyridoxal-phosphate dependent enzyme [Paraflavitalea devenefica]NII28105.1 pyridoxal-phosphate dependent enzyme [Paraflavitalea devenefica]